MVAKYSVAVSAVDVPAIMGELEPVRRKFFGRAGGAIRKAGKRRLKRARQLKLSELPADELLAHRRRVAMFKAGALTEKPRRREVVSGPGDAPVLHEWPKNPLRELLVYRVAGDASTVVVGYARTGSNLEKLEKSRPNVGPAFGLILPALPGYLRGAAGG